RETRRSVWALLPGPLNSLAAGSPKTPGSMAASWSIAFAKIKTRTSATTWTRKSTRILSRQASWIRPRSYAAHYRMRRVSPRYYSRPIRSWPKYRRRKSRTFTMTNTAEAWEAWVAWAAWAEAWGAWG